MYHIIFNPTAGKKIAQKNLVIVEKLLKERGLPFETHKTCAVRDAQEIARRLTLAGEADIIVMGGDGTLHETLNGIVDFTNVRVGLIPSGTGNDFAGRVGIPMDAEKAMSIIIDGEAKETDYLEFGGVRCMNVGGAGIDVDVLERCQRGKLKGRLKYFKCLLQSLLTFKGIPVVIESEGVERKHNALVAAACNGSQLGGGMCICPTASVEDGLMDVVIVDCIGKMKLIGALIQLMKGKILEYSLTTHFLCERVRVTSDKPFAVQLDGEIYRDLQFDVKVGKGLRFYR